MNKSELINSEDVRGKLHFEKISSITDAVMHEKYLPEDSDKMSLSERAGSGEIMKSGIDSLDDMLCSFENGHLYVIGGRPGAGKNALMLQIARNIASTVNKPVYILSLEMSGEQIVQRMISQAVRNGNLSERQRQQISTMPVYICDSTAGIEEIKRFVKEEINDGILLIDYLQLIDSGIDKANTAFHLSTTEIARELNRLAKEKNIPVVVCSQLSGAVEQRPDNRPVLQDLNNKEQYFDGVIFICRNSSDEDAELILAKNHHVPTGTVKVKFNRERSLFESSK